MPNPDKPSYTHGSSGTEPASAIDYASGDAVDANYFDYFINTPFEKIKAIIDQLNVIDSDGDGVVDEADYANDADASTYKGTDIDSDGDGIVNQADDADTLRGNSPSALRVAVEDAATTVLGAVTSINFGSGLSVTDDGDGTVTVSADTQADTQTDVSDDGSTVVTSTNDINFGTGLNVLDDGDNTVTVDDDQNATTYKGVDIDSDGDGKVNSADVADKVKGPNANTHTAGSMPEFNGTSAGDSNTSRGDLYVVNESDGYHLYLNE